ncbi:nucleoside hydrolase [Bifidobacterium longum]|uniref:Pyrimidine-specific ribonucleoside hydrolase RihA n=2 Tax=Bifidobacterium longum subsp. infantis TaxID=1682 RepID=A0ABP1X8D3_BIFLI|nr:nucleoside hydrolase [Bifidobacterium longum]ACJ51887.1 Inosine/uridine-preferring nucleoside hydrolase [Bifidobacterium longum subsp. infantis ATCC 15697 = JCM 1222 = DSM 20088]MBX4248801.1 nucleoside hydrolase [Bifidobacterium longum subsp. infantis]MEE4090029.1 nucleoside hydrolase [Bifidobacterium longum subsp. infantis]CEE96964.1 Pyrimidine-specific ribonucleoside hydrolase RihA [Bifidobacterium longum subsp. infantis]CEE99081.1 Pyrimidine-specific ribonucleoside hydrolase RihA [Bifido
MVQCLDRIIASMDTGVDDALALAYLLGSADECELSGVIASYGNVDANTAYANTRAVLDLFGRSDIPVFLGSEHPSWADAFIPDAGCAQFHGDDGLGNTWLAGSGALADGAGVPGDMSGDDMSVDVPDGVVSVGGYLVGDAHAHPALGSYPRVGRFRSVDRPQSATSTALVSGGTRRCSVDAADGIEYLIEQVREFGRNVTVLSTGPLTDVDAAITRAPDIASKLRLVMMGGTLTQPGNCWDAVAETNIIQDPEAANRVFHSGADITMVGLDVTHQCLLTRSAADRWRATGTKRGRFLADLADFSIKANLEADTALFSGGMPLHDPLAAAVALDSSLVDCFDLALRAETNTGDFNGVRGRTTGDPVGLVNHSMPHVHVALGVDSGRFLDEFAERMAEVCR